MIIKLSQRDPKNRKKTRLTEGKSRLILILAKRKERLAEKDHKLNHP